MHGFAIRLLQNLIVPTFVVDPDCKVIIWNAACERLTGIQASEVVLTGDHWKAFFAEPRPLLADLIVQGREDDLTQFYPEWDGRGRTEFGISLETRCRMPRVGRTVDLAVDAGPIFDHRGTLIAAVETVRDITAQKETQNELHTLATIDGLTGLANRRRFDVALQAEAARCARENRSLALIMVDVDFFKAYNDSLGHIAGDACLRSVADAIRSVLRRDTDMVARFGGEEFVVLLPDSTLDRAEDVADRILDALAALEIAHPSSTVAPVVSVSAGIAAMVGGEIDARALLSAADEALYVSKRRGRNRATVAAAALALI